MNPDAIEGLKVSLKGKGGGGGKGGDHGSVKLGELAQVISKGGRSFTVLAGEEDVSFQSTLGFYFDLICFLLFSFGCVWCGVVFFSNYVDDTAYQTHNDCNCFFEPIA